MKKAKLVLTAIAVLTVVGGALAFKANLNTHTFYYVSQGQPNCTATLTAALIQDNAGSIVTNLSTTSKVGTCSTKVRIDL